MKIALLNDTHCGIRNAASSFQEYQEAFYTRVFFPYLRKHNIKNIVHLGDYFDNRKSISITALHHNRRTFLDVLRADGIRMNIIPGNHDNPYANTDRVCSLRELLGEYKDCVEIHMRPEILSFDGFNLGLIPWIHEENLELVKKWLENTPADSVDLLCGHFEFGGFPILKGVLSAHDSQGVGVESVAKFKKVVSGHYHIKSEIGNVTYLGAQFQFTWNDAGIKHYFHIVDTGTHDIEAVENPIEMFVEMDYDDRNSDCPVPASHDYEQYVDKFVRLTVVHSEDADRLDDFVKRMLEVKTHDLKITHASGGLLPAVEENKAPVKTEFLTTPEAIERFVEQMEIPPEHARHIDADKEILKREMTRIYEQALLQMQDEAG